LEQFQLTDGRFSPAGGVLLSRLGLLYHEANNLDEARDCHERSLVLAEQLGFDTLTVLASGAAASTLAAQGDVERALGLLERAAHLNLSQTDLVWLHTREAAIRLRQGDRAFIKRWIKQSAFTPEDEPAYLRIEEQVIYARAMITLNRLDEARARLEGLEQFTLERGLHRWRLSVLILRALVAERTGDRKLAREKLEIALEFAAPERCIRAFLDEDPEVLHLLSAVRYIAPEFVDEILKDAGRVPGVQIYDAQPLDEPLSERELEVLALLTEGRSNTEIAGRLFITVGTVKRHVNHIYGKLEVGSRTQAVAKARELRLLD
jgi:LuxR family maltose regulon positive regulatory protein